VGLYAALGRLAEGLAVEQGTLRAGSRQPRYVAGAMEALVLQEKYQEALAELSGQPPETKLAPQVALAAAQTERALSHPAEAAAYLEPLRDLGDVEVSRLLGGLCEDQGRYPEALWEYGRALVGEPDDARAPAALVALVSAGRVPLSDCLELLSWAYAQGDAPARAACHMAQSLATALSTAEPLRWLASHPPPTG